MNNIQKLIDAVALDDKEEMGTAFASIMQDKIRAAVDVKTIEVAEKIYNAEETIKEASEEVLLERDSALVDMIKYSGPTGLFSKKIAKVITDDDEAALFPTGMVTRDGIAMQKILLDYIADKMGTDPKEKFGPYFDRVDLVGPGRKGKTALRGALDPKKKFKIKDLIKALKTFKEEVGEEELAEATIEIPTDEKAIKQFLDKAKMMRATEKDFDQSMKPLDLKAFAKFDKIARDHKDFKDAYQTGYDSGMGYDLPKGGGLEGNNPHKKNTFAYSLWMDIAGQGMNDA